MKTEALFYTHLILIMLIVLVIGNARAETENFKILAFQEITGSLSIQADDHVSIGFTVIESRLANWTSASPTL